MEKLYKFKSKSIPVESYLEMQLHKTELVVLKQDGLTCLFNKLKNEIYFLTDSDSENKEQNALEKAKVKL